MGGKVDEAENLEVGFNHIQVLDRENLLKDIPEKFPAFTYHWDYVSLIPPDFKVTARSDLCGVHSIKHLSKPIFGIQFHIEFDKINAEEIIDYLKEEISEEGINVEDLIHKTNLYSDDISKTIMKNFLDHV